MGIRKKNLHVFCGRLLATCVLELMQDIACLEPTTAINADRTINGNAARANEPLGLFPAQLVLPKTQSCREGLSR
jgi:hypothetical protein